MFDDCILEDAVNGAISGIFAATGQTCIAGSRLLVQETVHDRIMEKLLAVAKTAKLGNPMSLDTQVGPVTTPPPYQKILSYIDIAKSEGAACVLGGGPAGPEMGGGQGLRSADHLHRRQQHDAHRARGGLRAGALGHQFKDEAEAIEIANDVMDGLAEGVWTQSTNRSTGWRARSAPARCGSTPVAPSA